MKRIYLIYLIFVLAFFASQISEIPHFYKLLIVMSLLFFSSIFVLYKTIKSKESIIIRLITAALTLTILVCMYYWIEQSSILEFIFQ